MCYHSPRFRSPGGGIGQLFSTETHYLGTFENGKNAGVRVFKSSIASTKNGYALISSNRFSEIAALFRLKKHYFYFKILFFSFMPQGNLLNDLVDEQSSWLARPFQLLYTFHSSVFPF